MVLVFEKFAWLSALGSPSRSNLRYQLVCPDDSVLSALENIKAPTLDLRSFIALPPFTAPPGSICPTIAFAIIVRARMYSSPSPYLRRIAMSRFPLLFGAFTRPRLQGPR